MIEVHLSALIPLIAVIASRGLGRCDGDASPSTRADLDYITALERRDDNREHRPVVRLGDPARSKAATAAATG